MRLSNPSHFSQRWGEAHTLVFSLLFLLFSFTVSVSQGLLLSLNRLVATATSFTAADMTTMSNEAVSTATKLSYRLHQDLETL